MKAKGFTLIELLVVIAIIGIMASIVLVSTNNARNKGSNVRIRAEVAQIRTALEQNYANGSYQYLVATSGNNDILSTTSVDADITTLLCGIGQQENYPSNVVGDLSLSCNGIPNLHSGVVIYSNDTSWLVHDYGIYSSTTPGGYVCTDSFGNSVATTSAGIPSYSSLTSPSTALCQ